MQKQHAVLELPPPSSLVYANSLAQAYLHFVTKGWVRGITNVVSGLTTLFLGMLVLQKLVDFGSFTVTIPNKWARTLASVDNEHKQH